MLTEVARSALSLDTNVIVPGREAAPVPPVATSVKDPIGVHFTAWVSGSARSLIVTCAVPGCNDPCGGGAFAEPIEEHALAPAAINTTAQALVNCLCTSAPHFSSRY